MTKVRVLVLLAVVALLLFPAMASAQGGLQLPCRFHGKITIEGVAAPDGTVITAAIGGDEYSASTPAVYGAGSYMLEIKPGEGITYSEGAPVTFKIGATQAGTESFEAGGHIAKDFAIGEEEAEGGLIKTVTVTTLASGAAATVSYDSETGVLSLGIPAGPAGAKGADGASGPQGERGEGAPGGMALPIVALVLAVIAIGVTVMGMRRKASIDKVKI